MAHQQRGRSGAPSPLSSSTSSYSVSPLSSSPAFFASAPSIKNMSITQTYNLAHRARAKLSREASRPDHNLRYLVGHANLLDSLMIDIQDAEREQQHWFNEIVLGASTSQSHQSYDGDDYAVDDESESDSDDSDLDDISDDDDEEEHEAVDDVKYEAEGEDEHEDVEMTDAIPTITISQPRGLTRIPRRSSGRTPLPALSSEDDEDVQDDEEEDSAGLGLSKVASNFSPPPELDHDADSSDDEAMPPSPDLADALSFPTPSTAKDVDGDVVVAAQSASTASGASQAAHKAYFLSTENPSLLVPGYARLY